MRSAFIIIFIILTVFLVWLLVLTIDRFYPIRIETENEPLPISPINPTETQAPTVITPTEAPTRQPTPTPTESESTPSPTSNQLMTF